MSFDVVQEDDSLPGRLIAAVAVLAVLVIIVAVWTAARVLGTRRDDMHGARVSDAPHDQEGVVEQSLIDRSDRGLATERAAAERLSSYGWVDRSRGVARVPIDRAIDLYIEGQGSGK